MSQLVHTNPTLTNPASSTAVDANFADTRTWANGNIGNDNIASNAGITPTKLSAANQETIIQLTFYNPTGATVWPAPSATAPLMAVPIPGSAGDTAWVVTDISWFCTDTGTVVGRFDIRYGSFVAGVWTTTTAVQTAVDMSLSAPTELGNQGKSMENGSVSLAYAATAGSLALMSQTQGTGVLTTAGSYLTVAVRMRRVLQSA